MSPFTAPQSLADDGLQTAGEVSSEKAAEYVEAIAGQKRNRPAQMVCEAALFNGTARAPKYEP